MHLADHIMSKEFMENCWSLLHKCKTRTAQHERNTHYKTLLLARIYTANVQVYESLQIVGTYNNTKQLIQ
jgi:hypothetical protein